MKTLKIALLGLFIVLTTGCKTLEAVHIDGGEVWRNSGEQKAMRKALDKGIDEYIKKMEDVDKANEYRAKAALSEEFVTELESKGSLSKAEQSTLKSERKKVQKALNKARSYDAKADRHNDKINDILNDDYVPACVGAVKRPGEIDECKDLFMDKLYESHKLEEIDF